MRETQGLPQAEAAARPLRVYVIAGPDAGLTLRVDRELVVGTSELSDLVLTDATVSRRHCTLEPLGARVRVRDRGSRNGVLAGEVRILEAEVGPGAELRLGATTLRVDVDRSAAKVEAPASTEGGFGRFLGRAACLQPVYRTARIAAESNRAVLIEGESGTGKELLAEAIHDLGARAAGPFVVVDCGAIPETLIESELFGHERGAFTGAEASRKGAFEAAEGGTLFLDEIGELSPAMQSKLLGVLDRLQFRRVGGDRQLDADVRVIAATNRNLELEVEEGRFRLDLFHRLAVCLIRVPPLRDRIEDLDELAFHFLRAAVPGADAATLGPELRARLHTHRWPGNVRELRNYVERLAIFGDSALLHAPAPKTPPASAGRSALEAILEAATSGLPYRQARAAVIDAFTEAYVSAMLDRHGTPTHAAKAAGIARRHFHRLKQR